MNNRFTSVESAGIEPATSGLQSQRGATALNVARPGRIDLRSPSAISGRLAKNVSIFANLADARLEPTVLSSAYGARRVLASRAR